jgi:hypothetical protein
MRKFNNKEIQRIAQKKLKFTNTQEEEMKTKIQMIIKKIKEFLIKLWWMI